MMLSLKGLFKYLEINKGEGGVGEMIPLDHRGEGRVSGMII